MADQQWILAPEDFQRVFRALERQDQDFDLQLVADGSVKISGHEPKTNSDDVIEHLIFHPLRANSLAFIWLSGAWNHNMLDYIIMVNDVPIAFNTPFGLSVIPKSQYAVGRLPTGFTSAYNLAVDVLNQVWSANGSGDNA